MLVARIEIDFEKILRKQVFLLQKTLKMSKTCYKLPNLYSIWFNTNVYSSLEQMMMIFKSILNMYCLKFFCSALYETNQNKWYGGYLRRNIMY